METSYSVSTSNAVAESQAARALYEQRAQEEILRESKKNAEDMLKYNSVYQNLGVGQYIDLVT